MKEVVVIEELICPWCYSMNIIQEDVEVFQCKVCNRVVTEEDLEQEELKEE